MCFQKSKIAKIKRNNQKRQNFTKPVSSTNRKTKPQNFKKRPKPNTPTVTKKKDEVEPELSDDGADMLEMVEADDIEFLKNAIAAGSYNFLNKVRHFE